MARKAEAVATDAAVKVLAHGLDECAELGHSIELVAEAAQRLYSGPLSIRALCVLIADNMPPRERVAVGTIQAVLEAAATLDRFALRSAR